jgi:hypothetical protein
MTEDMATVEWLGQDPIDRQDDDEWYIAGYKRLYHAFRDANLLFESIPPESPDSTRYRMATLPMTTGEQALPVFTDHTALHRVHIRGHDLHQTLDGRTLGSHMVELGIGVIVNLASEFSRPFDEWELAWVAAGLMPGFFRPTESEELTKLVALLRGFLENRSIDSAHITWTVDDADEHGFAIVLSPAGRWPGSRRQALRDDFDRFISSSPISGVGFALVLLGPPQRSDHPDMISLI